jgi:hypothetical protein
VCSRYVFFIFITKQSSADGIIHGEVAAGEIVNYKQDIRAQVSYW